MLTEGTVFYVSYFETGASFLGAQRYPRHRLSSRLSGKGLWSERTWTWGIHLASLMRLPFGIGDSVVSIKRNPNLSSHFVFVLLSFRESLQVFNVQISSSSLQGRWKESHVPVPKEMPKTLRSSVCFKWGNIQQHVFAGIDCVFIGGHRHASWKTNLPC